MASEPRGTEGRVPPRVREVAPGTSPRETAELLARVLVPAVAEGPVARRPWAMGLAERFQWDRGAVRFLAALHARHGAGLLRVPLGRPLALVLDPAEAGRVLAATPDPFSPASAEKRGALGQFQPHGSLISHGPERRARRQVNEEALQPGRPLHEGAPHLAAAVREEIGTLVRRGAAEGGLNWDDFQKGWWRAVRRVVFGGSARDDRELVDRLDALRAAANWSVLLPRRRGERDRFLALLSDRVRRAEPGSLAAALPPPDATRPGTDPRGQVAHWLFAFDAVGMTVFRTLAVLACHPDDADRARAEADEGGDGADALPFLRACVLETVRLWPTTPLLLRETVRPAVCGGVTVPEGASVVLFTPYLHRGAPGAPHPDDFAPALWDNGSAYPALVPFSAGPGRCPGRDVVLLVAGTAVAEALRSHTFTVTSRVRPGPGRPLPATLDHFSLRFAVRAR
jgi:cytochrome P450